MLDDEAAMQAALRGGYSFTELRADVQAGTLVDVVALRLATRFPLPWGSLLTPTDLMLLLLPAAHPVQKVFEPKRKATGRCRTISP